MNELKVNLDNLTDEERSQLLALIERANSRIWTPRTGDPYSHLSSDGMVWDEKWTGGNADIDRLSIGNVFRTKREAEEELKRLKILTQWKRLSVASGEDGNTWNEKARHWCCCYNYETKEIISDWGNTYKSEGVYFTTESALINAINKIGEENVKKYILGVKE